MALAKLNGAGRKGAMRLSRFDLNLLVVFEAMMEERSVSRAADRLALSQPAVSHALGRLRNLIGDPLFVRTPAGMEPTARARQLATPVRRALEDIAHALEPEEFVPATAERVFRVAFNNHAALVLAPAIVRVCEEEAPGIRLEIRPSGTLPVEELLDRGDLDFAIMARPLDRQRFASRVLMEDSFQLVMREGHPARGGIDTLEAFAALARVEVSSSGEDMAFVERVLEDAGLPSRTTGAVPYLALLPLLRATDHVAIVRGQIANVMIQAGGFVALPLPFNSRRVASVLSWHQRHSGHAAFAWLEGRIARVAADLSG